MTALHVLMQCRRRERAQTAPTHAFFLTGGLEGGIRSPSCSCNEYDGRGCNAPQYPFDLGQGQEEAQLPPPSRFDL